MSRFDLERIEKFGTLNPKLRSKLEKHVDYLRIEMAGLAGTIDRIDNILERHATE
tara:strand:- start:10596 stop:10760 length:165 start_codon:yes stop_codon:yes gene_type:complete